MNMSFTSFLLTMGAKAKDIAEAKADPRLGSLFQKFDFELPFLEWVALFAQARKMQGRKLSPGIQRLLLSADTDRKVVN